MVNREEIAPNGDKRYIRRNAEGQIKTSVEKALRFPTPRHKAKHDAGLGQGDRVDHHAK